ncbi:putative beta-calactosidase [Xylariales sp. PMI_506]|nr:putative beta-calactosidase [Xylariales sp. PMI_506]
MFARDTLRAIAIAIAALDLARGAPSPSQTILARTPAFTYNNDSFLLHGKPYTIIGGQMDPQRIPYHYWRDRLSKVRAMGINTIFSYIFWNNLEPTQGLWLSDEPQNDVAEYFKIAQEVGLHVVLRPGPYICGEHEWGGFPAWLSEIPGMVVRTNNTPFLEQAKSYVVNLAEKSGLADLQISRGGPILMVQVENEYGSFGENHNYTAAMRDILRESFEVPLYTNDGGVDWTLEGGQIPFVLAEVDGGSWALPARDEYITDPTELGPLLDGEYYTWAPDQWGSYNPHNTTAGSSDDVSGIVTDIAYHLGNVSASISFYMVHGGTNFGFQNGALWQNRTTVFTTSYDYGAPLDETGRTTDLYFQMREAILPFVPNGSVPEPPANLPRASIPQFTLCPAVSLFDVRGEKTTSASPLTMEALGQSYGFTLYEHTATSEVEGFVVAGDRPRDRILVYVNDKIKGVMDSQYQHPLNVSVTLQPGDRLQLLIENLGRVDYYSRGNPYQNYVQDPWKGVKGNVSVNGEILSGWDMYSLQLDTLPSQECSNSLAETDASETNSPVFYRGSFVGPSISYNSSMTLDTFITVPNGIKGNVWVNDFHLGRYWLVGPQQSLYLPGSIVKPDEVNNVVILELEPWQMNTTSMVAYGVSERSWGNNPDPDCLKCV